MTLQYDDSENKRDSNDHVDSSQMDSPFQVNIFERGRPGYVRKGKGHWAVPWSDLMMTMFVFFAVLYIYQLANREWKPQSEGPDKSRMENVVSIEDVSPAIQESFPEIYELSKKNLSDAAQVELVKDNAVRIIVTNDLLFETGKADLKPGALSVLNEIAAVIRQTPYIVNVVGHTDNMPIHTDQFPTNWELSAVRACMVVRYMTESLGISGERFFVSAHSYHDPIRSNNSAENRLANRRVEIIITRDRP
ncbi:MAG: flagellar motor protein MotB [Desulfobacteraceae bacterium]|jgi:chemotaxis protein MotB